MVIGRARYFITDDDSLGAVAIRTSMERSCYQDQYRAFSGQPLVLIPSSARRCLLSGARSLRIAWHFLQCHTLPTEKWHCQNWGDLHQAVGYARYSKYLEREPHMC